MLLVNDKNNFCVLRICLKDNIFITAGKRSATRGIGAFKNTV